MNQSKVQVMHCPFDPNHVMPHDRFLNHLDKCKHPGKHNFTKCRFNPYHVVHKDIIDSHQNSTNSSHLECPERTKFNPIQDEEDEWWGVEPQPKNHKPHSQASKETNKKIEIQNKSKTYIGNNVICESFDQFDFSKEGK